ncbi:MAG: class I SAM-dependent methyltransferase [Dehalococcoidales bacterium]|nr:class I SAM-dependent methyltransferase [Dehalococcoidales bacterium]
MKKATNTASDEEKDAYIGRKFDRAAGSYDESRLVKSYQRRVQKLVIARMSIEKGMNVLDLGCGTGQGTIDIALKLEGTGNVIGIDLSEKMIEQAKKKLDNFKSKNVKFMVGSIGSVDYQDYFDFVFSTNAFHHFENKESIFTKVRQSLKPNGVFLVQDICDDYLLMRLLDLAGKIGQKEHVGSMKSKELESLFHKTGFTNIEVEKLKINWFFRVMIGNGIKRDSKIER